MFYLQQWFSVFLFYSGIVRKQDYKISDTRENSNYSIEIKPNNRVGKLK